MAKNWIQTYGNRKLVPLALTKEMVGPIDEIAHSLAGKFRFTCQTPARYSVAQHCGLGSRLLPPVFAGAFLLHELSEVYLPDIASPVKPHVFVDVTNTIDAFAPTDAERGAIMLVRGEVFGDRWLAPWHVLERQHLRVMLDALGLASLEPLIYSPEVKAMDLAMLAAEKRDLFGTEPEPWGLDIAPAPLAHPINPWDPGFACGEFLARFRELFEGRL